MTWFDHVVAISELKLRLPTFPSCLMVRYKFAHESEGKALSLSAFFLDAPREYAAGPWFVLLAKGNRLRVL